MDRKSLVILGISFLLLIAWGPLMEKLYPPKPRPAAQTNLVQAVSTSAPPVLSAARTNAQTNVVTQASVVPTEAQAEKLLVITNKEASYVFTSAGGGIKEIELRDYPQTIQCGRDVPGENKWAKLNSPAQVPVFAISAGDDFRADSAYTLSQPSSNVVRAERVSESGLAVVKEFRIETNHLFRVSTRIENRGQNAITLPNTDYSIGSATPLSETDDGMLMGLFWYNGDKLTEVKEGWFANKTLGCIPGTPRPEYLEGNSNVVWASVQNQFFTLVTIPTNAGSHVVAWHVTNAIPFNPKGRNPGIYQAALRYDGISLPAGQGLQRDYLVYAGPKEYKNLSRLGARMNNKLDLVMNFGFFGFFAKALLLGMNGLHSMGLSYGLAIIVITFIIKTLFWPLTNASTKSMKRMSALQPQMKELQEKYKDDPVKRNEKLMQFMREHKVNPMGGCLPILLQLPVFFGFYTMLQSAIELRGASFLWACDLSKPDTIFFIPFLGDFPVNPMPVIMTITMFIQMRLTPVSPGMDPMQQKIMQYMPLMFVVFLYNMSAGLNLYWTVQNILTIIQTKLTKTADPKAPPAPPKPAAPVWKPGQGKKKNK